MGRWVGGRDWFEANLHITFRANAKELPVVMSEALWFGIGLLSLRPQHSVLRLLVFFGGGPVLVQFSCWLGVVYSFRSVLLLV